MKLPLNEDRAVQAAAIREVFTMFFWNEIPVEITKVTRLEELLSYLKSKGMLGHENVHTEKQDGHNIIHELGGPLSRVNSWIATLILSPFTPLLFLSPDRYRIYGAIT
ncbi:hypothetical protein POM88_019953 [Heracleum sosnowskyi]|uniref:Uncharacterized protein n=1 Tax=Heracleum sosnowskyi TaxID=360622 RepID=A0AAD8MSC4_9APIA|nr:hypothetical protein POM88_019953 [Heracleum sosnowskyi]